MKNETSEQSSREQEAPLVAWARPLPDKLRELSVSMRHSAGQWMVPGWDGHKCAELLEQTIAALTRPTLPGQSAECGEAIEWSPAGYNKELAVDGTGKVLGEVCEHSIDPRWDARANDKRLGEYLNRDQAKAAVLAALSTPSALPAQAVTLTEQLQQQCSDWGTYWRASDAHGVQLTSAQAVELLQTALGVEVEIAPHQPQPEPQRAAERERIIRAAVAAMPSTNPLVADDLLEGYTMHTEADDIVAIWEAAIVTLLPNSYYMDPPDGGSVSLLEQLQRMASDAARYRAIRNPPYSDQHGDLYAMTFQGDGDIVLKGSDLDDAADRLVTGARK